MIEGSVRDIPATNTPTNDGRATAVIDIGKTNAKLVVWNGGTGDILFETSRPNHSIEGDPYRHLDTDGLWNFCIEALRAAAEKADVGRIVVTTHGATVAVLKGDELALPVVDYENTYDPAINQAYDAARDDFRGSQSPRLPAGLNFGRQLFALEANFPDEMARATDFLPYPQYWAWRLCGVKASEVTSLGCHSDLWRPHRGDWSHLARARGWDQKFPPLRKAEDVLGKIRPELAANTGLPADCAVHCGIHDSNASLVPLMTQIEQPFSLVSSGTWTVCFSVGGTGRPSLDEDRDTLCNVDLNGHAVPSARFMGGREYAFLAEGATENPDMGDIERLIASNCLAVPSFAEAGGPFHRHAGTVLNKTALPSERDKAALATVYSALMVDYCLEMIGGGGGPIIVEGPFATNPTFCQVLASLRADQRVLASPDSAGTSFGAAVLVDPVLAKRPRNLTEVPRSSCAGLSEYKGRWRMNLPTTDT